MSFDLQKALAAKQVLNLHYDLRQGKPDSRGTYFDSHSVETVLLERGLDPAAFTTVLEGGKPVPPEARKRIAVIDALSDAKLLEPVTQRRLPA